MEDNNKDSPDEYWGSRARYTLDGMYWDGEKWTPSDGTYAQANSAKEASDKMKYLKVKSKRKSKSMNLIERFCDLIKKKKK